MRAAGLIPLVGPDPARDDGRSRRRWRDSAIRSGKYAVRVAANDPLPGQTGYHWGESRNRACRYVSGTARVSLCATAGLGAGDAVGAAGPATIVLIGRLRRVGRRTFASLSSRNYRLFFAGVIVSTTGTWIQLIAESWLIIKLGGSGQALGVATAMQFIPIVILGSHAGVMVDRWSRRSLVLGAQSVAGGLAAVMGLLTLTGEVRIWMVWVAAFLVGCVDAFHAPARAAFSVELVSADLVGNAVSLTTAVTVSARAVGPAMGGLLVAEVGVAPCFLLNAASYVVGAVSIAAMNRGQLKVEPPVPRAQGQVIAGLRHVRQRPALRGVLVMVAVVGICGSNVPLLLTMLARATGNGPALSGMMMSCLGSGMLVGSLFSAGWHRPTARGVGLLALAMGFAYLLTAFVPELISVLVVIVVLGMVTGMFVASAFGALQLNAEPRMRGRVMAMNSIASLGPAAVGGPLLGWIAATWHVQAGLVVSGVCCLAACLVGIPVSHGRAAPSIPGPRHESVPGRTSAAEYRIASAPRGSATTRRAG